MSSHQSGKRVFWKNGLFWFCVIAAIYFLIVGIEEIIYKRLQGEWVTYTTKNSPLLDHHIRVLFTDNEGKVWIGTPRGLYVISPNGIWTIYTQENSGLQKQEIQALVVDKSGKTWVGTDNGLYVLDSFAQWKTYIGFENLRGGTSIKALVVDNLNRVWVGTNRGLSVFDADGIETIYTENNSGLIDNDIVALEVDRLDRIWIGTSYRAISMLDKEGNWITYHENNNNTLNHILTFLIDEQDQVWIGTDLGVRMLNLNGSWIDTKDIKMPTLSSIYIDAIALDGQNRLWIGTLNELAVMDTQGKTLIYAFSNSDLPGWVRALAIDKNERLWVGTSNGLSVIDLRNKLPRTVPADWLRLRTTVFAPINIISTLGSLFFFPVLIPIVGILYILLLILLPLSVVGLLRSDKNDDPILFYSSTLVFILSIIGVPLLWIFSLYLRIAFGD